MVRDGPARLEVLSPTLIRLEFAPDRRFQDAPTTTVVRRRFPAPPFRTFVRGGARVVRTSALVLRWRRGAPFSPRSLTLRTAARVVHPQLASSPQNLGGWRRGLDLADGPVPLHDGVLSRAGYYVLDDTATPLRAAGSPGFVPRPRHAGAYQDLYLFAYGHDYAAALRDLRDLTGPAPVLPRSAFGVWFSRYWPYSERDYHDLLAEFRAHGVPLDTLSVDTDWKREANPAGSLAAAILAGAPGLPYAWNGWEWNPQLFPDPKRFLDWAHAQGIAVTVNIHPSIDSTDPEYGRAPALPVSTGECELLQADPAGTCHVFDWADPRQLAAYFALHAPLERDGVDFFWLDWCCDASRADAPGLTPDTFINSRYAARERARGLRWLAFSRIGGSYEAGDAAAIGDGAFAEHRSTIHFTGDTCATWAMLAFEAEFTASEGNIGLPYVSHDIGSFHGPPVAGQCGPVGAASLSAHLPDDLYARWVQLGTFQPLDRLHSDHGDRLPWSYGAEAQASATEFLKLREALVPYLYSLAKEAHATGLPMARGLYLEWPSREAAYAHPSEYLLGRDVVVAPVTAPGDPAPATVWVPPGAWIDLFTREVLHGPAVVHEQVPLSRMPVLVRPRALGKLPALR